MVYFTHLYNVVSYSVSVKPDQYLNGSCLPNSMYDHITPEPSVDLFTSFIFRRVNPVHVAYLNAGGSTTSVTLRHTHCHLWKMVKMDKVNMLVKHLRNTSKQLQFIPE